MTGTMSDKLTARIDQWLQVLTKARPDTHTVLLPNGELELVEVLLEARALCTYEQIVRTAAGDDRLTDREVRNIAKYISSRSVAPADLERTKELAARFGWSLSEASR